MIRLLYCGWLMLAATSLFAQQKRIQIDRPLAGTITFRDTVSYDPSVSSDATASDPGTLNDNIAELPTSLPPNTAALSTQVVPAVTLFNTQDYPIRTSTKLFAIEDDTLRHLCSAQMISQRHVMSSAHCFFPITGPSSDSLRFDSILACPMYNNGSEGPIPCQLVTEVAHFEGWSLSNAEDISILTLPNDVGFSTGWLGMAFEEDDAVLSNKITHRFSYVEKDIPVTGTGIAFNGDTLYYQTVQISPLSEEDNNNYIGSDGLECAQGSSGSALIEQKTDGPHLTYGPLTWSSDCRHNRLRPRTFYPIKAYIEEAITAIESHTLPGKLIFYPNPSNGYISVTNWPRSTVGLDAKYQLTDISGRNMTIGDFNIYDASIDFTNIPAGNYYLTIWNEQLSKSGLVIIKPQ